MITINLDKAKNNIAHPMRRDAREAEFKPLDHLIAAKIPGTDDVAVEAERQAIRDKYATIQANIDAATTPEEIKAAMTFLPIEE